MKFVRVLCVAFIFCRAMLASCFLMSVPMTRNESHDRNLRIQISSRDKVDNQREDISPILKLASAHTASQALYAIVRLGIPDILGNNTLPLSTIASKVGPRTNKDALLRTMRLLTTVDILTESCSPEPSPASDEISFHLTKTGSMLQTNHPSCMDSCVLHWLEAPLWNSLLELPDFISGTTKQLPFETANDGISSDCYYSVEDHPESLQHANAFVRKIYDGETHAVLNGFNWKSLAPGTRVLDIGGHHGKVVGSIKKNFPHIEALSLDLPVVIDSAPTAPDGVTLVKGNILDSSTIPSCDVILLKHFLDRCMWDEEQSIDILKSCHQALSPSDPDSKVIIAETVVPDIGETDPNQNIPLYMDALYMVVGRERQRTKSEWQDLANKSGFQVDSITATNSPTCSIIVLTKNLTT